MHLRVNSIQRFSLHDGPGIRTTVFLQGCPLRCWWCHNPETIPLRSDAMQAWSIDDLVAHVLRDERFWRASDGGLTLSGGEPLAQPQGAAALLQKIGHLGHHRCVETAGHVSLASVRAVAPHVDLWLWDIKAIDAARFRAGTGGDASRPMENLRWVLSETDADVRVRTPVIAGFNDDTDEAARIADFVASLPRRVPIELLPGHNMRKSGGPPTRSAKVSDERLSLVQLRIRAGGCELFENRS